MLLNKLKSTAQTVSSHANATIQYGGVSNSTTEKTAAPSPVDQTPEEGSNGEVRDDLAEKNNVQASSSAPAAPSSSPSPVYSTSGEKGTHLPEPEKQETLKWCLLIYRIYLALQGLYGTVAGLIIITIAALGLADDHVAVYLGPNYVYSPKARSLLSWAIFLGLVVVFYNSCFLCVVIWKMNRKWLKRQGIFKILIALGWIIWMVMVFAVAGEKETLKQDWIDTLNSPTDWDKLCLVQDVYNCSGWSNSTTDDVLVANCSDSEYSGWKPDAHVPLPTNNHDSNHSSQEEAGGVSSQYSLSSGELAKEQEALDQTALDGCSSVRFGGLITVAFFLALFMVICIIIDLPFLLTLLIHMYILSRLEKMMEEEALLAKEEEDRKNREFQINHQKNPKYTHV